MKKIFYCLAFISLLITITLSAQTINKSEIKNNSEIYYWGESFASNIEEASTSALKSLLHQISFKIKHTFVNKVKGENEVYKENVESILETYAAAALNNLQTIKEQNDDEFSVFHYIKKEEVVKIFDERKKLVFDIYEKAKEFEGNFNIAYALKWYYFCTILMNSIPEPNLYYNETNLVTEIPYRIGNIINNVDFILTSNTKINEKEREIILKIQSDSKQVNLLDFSFWDGGNQVNVRGYDGEGIFRLIGSGTELKNLKLAIKYNYYESRGEIQEVADLWETVNKTEFKNIRDVNLKEFQK